MMTRYALPEEPPVGSIVYTPASRYERTELGWQRDGEPYDYDWRSLLRFPLHLRTGGLEAPRQYIGVPAEPPVGTVVRQVGGRRTWTRYERNGSECTWAEDPDGMYWQWFALLLDFGAVDGVSAPAEDRTTT